ncbi:hypothetical protein [Mailhella massiliensis]|uniref:hypothetical protein n=1 Tax=Mailhella massiliensis TaxID=1903261 RepID=UPI00097D7A7D|nr:hypothetical protein [Mailhella massiliensis]
MPTRPARPGKTELSPMAEPSRSSRKLAACLAVLLCAGAGAWLFFFDGGSLSPEEAKQAVQSLMGTSREETQGVPVREETASEPGKSAAQEEKKGGEVSAAISTQPRPAPSDPAAELLARVEKAMEETGPALPGGDSASGTVENRPPAVDETRQDSVVTGAFVRDLARWLAASYVPSRREDRSGRSTATLVQGNFRYSNSGTLRSVERDPLKGRSGVLNYVFTPGMLEALYRMYAPRLVEEMELAARSRGRQSLSDAQVADMFMVYAGEFQRLSVSLEAASAVDLPALAASIRRAAEKEADANDDFARAYTALSMAREAGNSDEVAIQSRRMAESSHVAGMYAARQERARDDMAYALRRKAAGKALPDAELVFLGEWLSRRHASVEAIRAAADVCGRMAGLCEERARAVTAPHDAAAEEPQPVQQPSAPKKTEEPAPQPAAAPDLSSVKPEAAPAEEGMDAVPQKAAETPSPAPATEQKKASSSSFVREVSGPLSFEPLPKSDREKPAGVAAQEPAAAEEAKPSSAGEAAKDKMSAVQPGASVSGEEKSASAPVQNAETEKKAPEASASGHVVPSSEQKAPVTQALSSAQEQGNAAQAASFASQKPAGVAAQEPAAAEEAKPSSAGEAAKDKMSAVQPEASVSGEEKSASAPVQNAEAEKKAPETSASGHVVPSSEQKTPVTQALSSAQEQGNAAQAASFASEKTADASADGTSSAIGEEKASRP